MAITVTHKFVSTKGDSSDLTLINPSNWNDQHVVINSSITSYNVNDYNFCQTINTNLVAHVVNTITLTPVPLGVNGTDINHWLQIAGTEVVLITGGNAVSGASSGTITFVPANNRTASWQLCSATAGIQEAIWAAPDYSFIHVPAKPSPYYQIYAQVYIPTTKHLTIEGDGTASIVVLNQTSQNGFYFDGNPESVLNFGRLNISAASLASDTSHYILYINNWSPGAQFYNLNLYGAANHIALNGQPTFNNIFIGDFQNIAITGLGARFGGNWNCVSCVNFNTGHALAGVYVAGATNTTIDGWICVNCSIGGDSASGTGLDFGIFLNPGTKYMSNVELTDCYIESCLKESFILEVDSGAMGAGIYKFTSTRFANNSMSPSAIGVLFTTTNTSPMISEVIINGCYFGGSTNPILLSGVANCTISNNIIAGQGITVAGTQIGVGISSGISAPTAYCKNITITNNVIGYGQNGITVAPGNAFNDGPLDIAIRVDSASHTNIVIANNIVYGTSGTPLQVTLSNSSVIKNNQGVDDIVPSVASASNLALPVNPNFAITGTTAINSISGAWTGRTGYFRTVTGAVTFNPGATIGNGGTTVSSKVYNYYFDGTYFWIFGQGF